MKEYYIRPTTSYVPLSGDFSTYHRGDIQLGGSCEMLFTLEESTGSDQILKAVHDHKLLVSVYKGAVIPSFRVSKPVLSYKVGDFVYLNPYGYMIHALRLTQEARYGSKEALGKVVTISETPSTTMPVLTIGITIKAKYTEFALTPDNILEITKSSIVLLSKEGLLDLSKLTDKLVFKYAEEYFTNGDLYLSVDKFKHYLEC
jgi:hypothetical protein